MKLKLVTLNMYQGQLLDAALTFLTEQHPDIVTLQEVYNGRGPSLAAKFRTFEALQTLGFTAADHEPAYIELNAAGKIPSGNAILSRFPIKNRDAVFFNDPFRDDYVDDIRNNPTQPHVLQHVELDTPAGSVHVFNLHGTWDLDGDNFSDYRRKMSEAVIAGVQGKTKVLLAGDTNAKPTNQAMRAIEQHLVSVFGTELQSTFNMKRKDNPGYATAAVDMVFISQDITIVDKDCPDVDVSDHRPLVVTVDIPEN